MLRTLGLGLVISIGLAGAADATLVDFTGGTVYQFGGGTAVTDTTTTYDDVDYYEEAGMRVDFIGPSGVPLSYNVGDYYGVGNDVLHGHWVAGTIGDMESIRVELLDSSAFDLNYLKITSNTDNPGIGAPIGTMEVYLNALADGTTVSASLLIPADDWGFAGPNSELFLGADFDGIKAFTLTYGSGAVGLGLDEFEFETVAIPEPATGLLVASALAALGWARRGSRACGPQRRDS